MVDRGYDTVIELRHQGISGGHVNKVEELEKKKAAELYKIQLAQFETQKTQSLINIAISTAEAIIKAYATLGPIGGTAAAALIGGLGAKQASLVASQDPPPPPTAQTGTLPSGITIPETASSRTDNVAVTAGAGETVNVTPRGGNAGREMRLIVEIQGQAIIDEIINPGIESGDIRITTDNIQGGVQAS